MKALNIMMIVVLTCIICVAGISCSKGEKTADTISKTLVEQPMDKTKRTKIMADLTTISRAAEIFFTEKGRFPSDLDEMVQGGYLATYPREPFGGEYIYDASTGKVKSSTHPKIRAGQDM